MNIDKITEEYLLDIANRILRYITLLGNKNEVITATDSTFTIHNEPLYRTVTMTFLAEVEDGIFHKFENVFRTDLTTNETTYTRHEFEKVIATYPEDCDEVVGRDIIHHKAGEEVVAEYILYGEYGTDTYYYMEDGVHKPFQVDHYPGDPARMYETYERTEYDEYGTVIHIAGDVILDAENRPIFHYRVYSYDYAWQNVASTSTSLNA